MSLLISGISFPVVLVVRSRNVIIASLLIDQSAFKNWLTRLDRPSGRNSRSLSPSGITDEESGSDNLDVFFASYSWPYIAGTLVCNSVCVEKPRQGTWSKLYFRRRRKSGQPVHLSEYWTSLFLGRREPNVISLRCLDKFTVRKPLRAEPPFFVRIFLSVSL